MAIQQRIKIYPRQRRSDDRGWLLKVLDGGEADLPDQTGECYLVSAFAGKLRGAHFHRLAAEWFTVVAGSATLLLADPGTGERFELFLDSLEPVTVHVPAGIAHAFRVDSGSEQMLLVAYSDRRYDPQDTIQFSFV